MRGTLNQVHLCTSSSIYHYSTVRLLQSAKMALSLEHWKAPKLEVEQFLSPEQIEEVKSQRVFTTAQLHLLKQQIESLRRINITIRTYRHKKRTGQELSWVAARPAAASAPIIAVGGSRLRAHSARGARSPAQKRGREDSEEPDLDIVDDASPSEASEEEEEEPELSDYETPEESDGEAGAAKLGAVAGAGVTSPRRVSQRARGKPQRTLKEDSSSSSSSGSEEESGGERERGTTKSAAGAGGKQKRTSFVVLKEDAETASSGAIQLPQLQPVPVEWSSGDDALCSVCGDGDDADGNSVLLCEGRGCSVAVHQTCYGIAKVPKGKWLCDGCKAKLSPKAANCACCPVVGGALRKVVMLGRVVPPGGVKQAYVHVACALWTPEITLADPDHMAGVQLDHMTAARAALECGLCKQAGGAVVQCSFPNCYRPFHVLCGRVAGQLLTFRETDGEAMAFCGMHSKERFARTRDALVEGRELGQGEAEEAEGDEGGSQGAAPAEPPSEYELQRQRNIERNKQMLAAIRGQA